MKTLIKYFVLFTATVGGFLAGRQRLQIDVTNPLVQLYLQAAMQRAIYSEATEDRTFRGEIPGFRGVFGYGETIEIAHTNLTEALKVWVMFRLEYKLVLPRITSA